MSDSENAPIIGLPIPAVDGLKFALVDMVLESLFWGVHSVLVIIASYILINRGLSNSWPRKLMMGILVVMFSVSSAYLAVNIWGYFMTYDGLLFEPVDHTAANNRALVSQFILPRINYFISDAIVVWRAWSLWDRKILVKMILCICLLGSAVATFFEGAMGAKEGVENPDAEGTVEWNSGLKTLMFTLPLLITNLVATTLVAIRAWEYRALISTQFSKATNSTLAGRVILLLVESGFIYSFVWLLAILALFNVFPPMGTVFIMGSLPYITCIYPTLIIILIALDRSECDSTFRTTEPVKFNAHGSGATSVTRTNNTGQDGTQVEVMLTRMQRTDPEAYRLQKSSPSRSFVGEKEYNMHAF